MTLCNDVQEEEEITEQIKDVLWEVDRICYKYNIKLQWDGTENL